MIDCAIPNLSEAKASGLGFAEAHESDETALIQRAKEILMGQGALDDQAGYTFLAVTQAE